jgi:hypothetical protein
MTAVTAAVDATNQGRAGGGCADQEAQSRVTIEDGKINIAPLDVNRRRGSACALNM